MRKLITKDGKELELDKRIIDSKGKEWIYQGISPSGKMYAWDPIGKGHREFFPSEFECSLISN